MYQRSPLAEMECVKDDHMKLIPGQRNSQFSRHMYVERKAVETECRQRVALESFEKSKREREERDKATERLRREKCVEEMSRTNALQQGLEKRQTDRLKQQRLGWLKVEDVEEEELVKLHRCITVKPQASTGQMSSELKADEQGGKKKTQYNNWLGEQENQIDSESVEEKVHAKVHPDSATYPPFAAKPGPKSEDNPETPKHNDSKEWLQKRLRVGFWLEKFQDHRQKKDEKRKLNAEEQYAKWTAYKASCTSLYPRQYDCYTGGFAADRNSILKSLF